jgi:hypothetical protein
LRVAPATEAAILAAVDALFDYLADRRPAEALACFDDDDDVALFGSEASEAFRGRAALRRFLEALLARVGPRFILERPLISTQGDAAWFTTEGRVEIGGVAHGPYRLTGVLRRRDGRWYWVLFNGSEPLPDRT